MLLCASTYLIVPFCLAPSNPEEGRGQKLRCGDRTKDERPNPVWRLYGFCDEWERRATYCSWGPIVISAMRSQGYSDFIFIERRNIFSFFSDFLGSSAHRVKFDKYEVTSLFQLVGNLLQVIALSASFEWREREEDGSRRIKDFSFSREKQWWKSEVP